MDKQQLQKIEQACFLASMMMQLSNIVRSGDDMDFSDCPPEILGKYADIANSCSNLMDEIRVYVRNMFKGEGEG